jgi:glycosyltransferase involved in cell wall biosynthesis
MPKISIVIPVYKVEKYLSACLDSVLQQTFQDWEAICVNDGSPDNCGEILSEYAQKDHRIKVITQENQGLSMARNNGLKKANGKYILFFDSDDSIHPQLLEICAHFAEKENADMVSFNFQNHKKNDALFVPNYTLNEIKSILTDTPLYFQKKRHKHKITVNAWSKLYKKSLIQDLSFIPGITMEDYPHTYAVLAKHPKTVVLDIPLYYYRYNPQSISSIQIDPKNIQDYQTGLNFIIDVYNTASKKEKHFVLHELFPNILKQQLNKIVKSPKDKQPELYRAFSKELKDLNEKGWLKLWGHKIGRYLKYRKLIQGIK